MPRKPPPNPRAGQSLPNRGGTRPGAGRPPDKVVALRRELASKYSDEAMRKVVEFMRGTDPKLAYQAAELILAYALGRPRQQVSVDGGAGAPVLCVVGVNVAEV